MSQDNDKFQLVHSCVCLCAWGCARGTQVRFGASGCTPVHFFSWVPTRVHSGALVYLGAAPRCTVLVCAQVHSCMTRVHLDVRKEYFSPFWEIISQLGFSHICSLPKIRFSRKLQQMLWLLQMLWLWQLSWSVPQSSGCQFFELCEMDSQKCTNQHLHLSCLH